MTQANFRENIFSLFQPIHPFDIEIDCPMDAASASCQREMILQGLAKIFPLSFCPQEKKVELLQEQINKQLPLLTYCEEENFSRHLSLYFLAELSTVNSGFTLERAIEKALSNKQLHTSLRYSINFKISTFGQRIYTLSKLILQVDHQEELKNLRYLLPLMENEMRQEVASHSVAINFDSYKKEERQQLIHPVFMPCNEEEIMRNMLTLSAQLKYVRDLPQVFISFDGQSHLDLFFMVIAVRLLKDESTPSIQSLFQNKKSILHYLHDRIKILGYLRKHYAKEATVFRVKLRKELFLRRDHSIDLIKARELVVSELERLLGTIRDFNGGMISKQNQLLAHVRSLLVADSEAFDELLLQNFFYSLSPATLRSIIDPLTLTNFFLFFVEFLDLLDSNHPSPPFKILRELEFIYAIALVQEPFLRDEANKTFSKFALGSELITLSLSFKGLSFIGYLYRCDDSYKQELFCHTLQHTLFKK